MRLEAPGIRSIATPRLDRRGAMSPGSVYREEVRNGGAWLAGAVAPVLLASACTLGGLDGLSGGATLDARDASEAGDPGDAGDAGSSNDGAGPDVAPAIGCQAAVACERAVFVTQ